MLGCTGGFRNPAQDCTWGLFDCRISGNSWWGDSEFPKCYHRAGFTNAQERLSENSKPKVTIHKAGFWISLGRQGIPNAGGVDSESTTLGTPARNSSNNDTWIIYNFPQ